MIRHCPSRPLTAVVAGAEGEMVGPLKVEDVDGQEWRMACVVEKEEEEECESTKLVGEEVKEEEEEEEAWSALVRWG